MKLKLRTRILITIMNIISIVLAFTFPVIKGKELLKTLFGSIVGEKLVFNKPVLSFLLFIVLVILAILYSKVFKKRISKKIDNMYLVDDLGTIGSTGSMFKVILKMIPFIFPVLLTYYGVSVFVYANEIFEPIADLLAWALFGLGLLTILLIGIDYFKVGQLNKRNLELKEKESLNLLKRERKQLRKGSKKAKELLELKREIDELERKM